MEIYKLVIIDKLYDKFKLLPMKIWEINKNLIFNQRVPKDKSKLIISNLINTGYLIKTDKATYKLKDDIKKEIDVEMNRFKVVRNKIFLE